MLEIHLIGVGIGFGYWVSFEGLYKHKGFHGSSYGHHSSDSILARVLWYPPWTVYDHPYYLINVTGEGLMFWWCGFLAVVILSLSLLSHHLPLCSRCRCFLPAISPPLTTITSHHIHYGSRAQSQVRSRTGSSPGEIIDWPWSAPET